jgi:hypothetical protein
MNIPSGATRTGRAGSPKESRIAARGYYTSMSVIYDEDDAHQCVGGEEARDVADNIPASRIHIVTLSMLPLVLL